MTDGVLIDGNFNVKDCVCTPQCECPCWQLVGLVEPGPCCCAPRKTPLSTTLNEAVESRRELERFRAALQDIAEQDFRGNRPWSATRAHQALHPETGTS